MLYAVGNEVKKKQVYRASIYRHYEVLFGVAIPLKNHASHSFGAMSAREY